MKIDMGDSYFRVPVFVVRLSGIPINMKTVSRLKSVWNAGSIACFYLTYLAVLLDFVAKEGGIEDSTENVRIAFGMSVIAWMHLHLRIKRGQFGNLIKIADSFQRDDLPHRDPVTGNLTMTGYIPLVNVLAMYGCVLVAVFHTIQSAFRMVTNRAMIFPTWYPFDASVSPLYEIINLIQGVASLVCINICVGFPSLYATLVCVACSQLEKLKLALLDIRQTYVVSEQDCGEDVHQQEGEGDTCVELSSQVQKRLNNCICHHQEIKQYMKALEETINFFLCGLFLLLLAALCFISFSAAMSWGDVTELSQALVMYCLMIGILFVFCWLGTQLSVQLPGIQNFTNSVFYCCVCNAGLYGLYHLQAESVKQAAWGCDWVGTPVSFQRCVAFIIATADVEFTLTAGKFVPVSNKTMMNMMSQTVSFFMFLLQMKDKSEGPREAK